MDQRMFLTIKVSNLIKNQQIKDFVLAALEKAPEYIWTLDASTSGQHHNGETQTEHVIQALVIAEHLADIIEHPVLKELMPPDHLDLLYAAVCLHDLYKCGKPGQVNKIDGKPRTDNMHPLYVPQMLKNIEVLEKEHKYIKAENCEWWLPFCRAVALHSGPWSPIPFDRAPLRSFDNLPMLTFLCDYLASRKGIHIDFEKAEHAHAVGPSYERPTLRELQTKQG